MSSISDTKPGFPAVYVDEHTQPPRSCNDRARRIAATVVKALVTLLLMGCCLGLVYQTIRDKQSYEALLAKYTALQNEKMGTSGFPVGTLVRRGELSSSSISYVYSTTTETEATTITVKKTASTTPAPTPTKCMGPMATVTVTVTACPLSSSTLSSTSTSSSILSSSTSASSASVHLPNTVIVTHISATTVYITDKGLVTPKVQTLTATELQTFTVLMTVNGTISTSTSTADPVSGAMASSTTHLTYFPNATNPLEPYQTTSYGGVPLSTANFTITVPPVGTTTSQSDPMGTIVTVSGARKNANVGALMVVAAAISFLSMF